MLFYNEDDKICVKITDSSYKILYDWDIIELEGKHYTDCYEYFYEGINYGDGDYETNWDVRVHPRKMNILEMEDILPKHIKPDN